FAAANFDKYEITKPVRRIQDFVIEDLSNWYVRLTRRRFWAPDDDPSKMRAYLTLYRILEGVCRLIAPVAPFTSELIWQELAGQGRSEGAPLSVHMTEYPRRDASRVDMNLVETMDLVRTIVTLGRAARARKNIKTRQPLAKLLVTLPGEQDAQRIEPYLYIIRDELNVKAVETRETLDDLVTYSAKLNFKVAGPKLGKHAKAAAAAIAALSSDDVKAFARSGKLTLDKVSPGLTLTTDEVEVKRTETDGYAVEFEGGCGIALETTLSDELLDEGFAREIVNKVQNMRKASGFEVTDSIEILLKSSPRLRQAAEKHAAFIQRETLARSMRFLDNGSPEGSTEWNINGEPAAIAVIKV
ncbi:MAG: isoleucine--tRNA ligase, partial [Candidatus Zixiibacteriota bacterium]